MTSLIILFVSKAFHVFIAAFLQKAVVASHMWWCRGLTVARNFFEATWIGTFAVIVVGGEGHAATLIICIAGLFGIEAGVRLGDHFLNRTP